MLYLGGAHEVGRKNVLLFGRADGHGGHIPVPTAGNESDCRYSAPDGVFRTFYI